MAQAGKAAGVARSVASPRGVCVDSSGRIYIADSGDGRIVRIDDMDGSNFVVYGSYGGGPGHFSAPEDVRVDAAGRVYALDGERCRIVRIDDLSGRNWTTYGTYSWTESGQYRTAGENSRNLPA